MRHVDSDIFYNFFHFRKSHDTCGINILSKKMMIKYQKKKMMIKKELILPRKDDN